MLKLAAPPQTIESVLAGFLPRYAADFPNMRVKLVEALGMDQVQLLERGEVHIGIRHDQGINPWFDSIPLPSDDVLAAYSSKFQFGHDGAIDIVSLAPHPLLLFDSGYSVRRLFNAACRLANVEPEILLESRAPHTLLALAEAGQGVAVIPSVQRADGYRVNIARVTHRRKPLRDRYVIQWDKRRPMPTYVQNFCTLLATYMREVLPITHPSCGKSGLRLRPNLSIGANRRGGPSSDPAALQRAARRSARHLKRYLGSHWSAARRGNRLLPLEGTHAMICRRGAICLRHQRIKLKQATRRCSSLEVQPAGLVVSPLLAALGFAALR